VLFQRIFGCSIEILRIHVRIDIALGYEVPYINQERFVGHDLKNEVVVWWARFHDFDVGNDCVENHLAATRLAADTF
jgi:hypothetical protein